MKLSIFILMAAVQLAAPAWMIGQQEWILRHGTVYKFRTAPVDPYDPFRGRYVMLGFDQNTAPWTGSGPLPLDMFDRPKYLYAPIVLDDDGFAKFSGAGPAQPESGDYLRVLARKDYSDQGPLMLWLELPFDRYYMNEHLAPEAEARYQARSVRESRDAYVTVRVLNGKAVLEQLYLGGKPIEEVIKESPAAR